MDIGRRGALLAVLDQHREVLAKVLIGGAAALHCLSIETVVVERRKQGADVHNIGCSGG